MNTLQKTQQAMSLQHMRQRPHWSYSRINGLVNHCSLQWAFRYVYNIEPAFTSPALVFGTAWHRTLELVFNRRREGSYTTTQDAAAFFDEQFRLECSEAEPAVRFGEKEDTETLAQKGREMLPCILEELDTTERVVNTSVPFSAPLVDADDRKLDAPLVGEFDCVLEKEGTPVIVDWKTAAKRWPEHKVKSDLQPTCYLYAWYHMHPWTHAEFRFDVVAKAKTPTYTTYRAERDIEDFRRLGEMVRVLERMIQAEAFLPDEQSYDCSNCPYTEACRRWHREFVYREMVHLAAA